MTVPDEAQSRSDGLPLSNILLVLLLGVVWGVNWPAIRISVLEIEPWTFRTICLGAGASMLVVVALARKKSLRVPRTDILPLVAVGLLNVTAYHMLTAYGLTKMDAGRGAILTFTFPLWSVLLGTVVLKERITMGRFAALLLGLSAMALLIGTDIGAMGRSPVGAAIMLAQCGYMLAHVLAARAPGGNAPGFRDFPSKHGGMAGVVLAVGLVWRFLTPIDPTSAVGRA